MRICRGFRDLIIFSHSPPLTLENTECDRFCRFWVFTSKWVFTVTNHVFVSYNSFRKLLLGFSTVPPPKHQIAISGFLTLRAEWTTRNAHACLWLDEENFKFVVYGVARLMLLTLTFQRTARGRAALSPYPSLLRIRWVTHARDCLRAECFVTDVFTHGCTMWTCLESRSVGLIFLCHRALCTKYFWSGS